MSVLAVGGGAAAGAWLRWGLSIVLNPIMPLLPLGTLAANLVGGLLMGIALETIARHATITPETRLLLMTGFLGGLTTFSTFSAEVTALLVRREWWWSALAVGLHVAGSIALTVLGIVIARTIFDWVSA
ncbi:MAG: fluoride efflux transporter CrcB [Betaproteobacteria bacterium]